MINTIPTNYLLSMKYPEYLKELPNQSEPIPENTTCRISDVRQVIEDNGYSGQEEPCNGLSTGHTTMQVNKCIHPLPISNQRMREFIEIQQHKSIDEVIKDEFLPSVFQVRELRDTNDTPPQVRLQASQIFINKIIPDRIEINQSKQVVDINKLIDQAMALSQLSKQDTIIDVTPTDSNDKDIR